jgi:hypothetical protein
MHDTDDTLTRFQRRFRAIEEQIPDRSFESLRLPARPRSRYTMPSLAVGAAILLVLALVVVPPALRRSNSSPAGSSPTPAVTVLPSPTPRLITSGIATWTVMCNGASDADCEGAVGLFTNNLARSWAMILDQSGGRLTVQPRACPTRIDGLTARLCWDVTAVISSGPFCMVVAHDANDSRYPAFFEIGGQDGTGRAGGPPTGWPMCLDAP